MTTRLTARQNKTPPWRDRPNRVCSNVMLPQGKKTPHEGHASEHGGGGTWSPPPGRIPPQRPGVCIARSVLCLPAAPHRGAGSRIRTQTSRILYTEKSRLSTGSFGRGRTPPHFCGIRQFFRGSAGRLWHICHRSSCKRQAAPPPHSTPSENHSPRRMPRPRRRSRRPPCDG